MISGRGLVMAIQAVDREIQELRALPTDSTTAGNEQAILLAYEATATELEAAYATFLAGGAVNYPPYAALVTP